MESSSTTLHVSLLRGIDLLAMDEGNTSDPYVGFYWNGKKIYTSKIIKKTLFPEWNESFSTEINGTSKPLKIEVRTHHFCSISGNLVLNIFDLKPFLICLLID